MARLNYYIEQGDCLELMKNIPDGSVDLILCDPPYGNVKNGIGSGIGTAAKKGYAKTEWDTPLLPVDVFESAARILRPNGKLILFSQEPYTSKLITSQIPKLPFSQRGIWLKDMFANALGVNKNLVCFFEDILIFNKVHPKHDFAGSHPLRQYFLEERDKSGLSNSDFRRILGNEMGGRYFTSGSQFILPTLKNYEKLQTTGFFCREWNELKRIDDEYRSSLIEEMNQKFPNVFNLRGGEKFKSNVFTYPKEKERFHPTQKPVLLLEDLIYTYTNPGDCVLDNCMGSGSTGVACVNTGRSFIGMELDAGYLETAKQRIYEAQERKCDENKVKADRCG